MTAGCRLAMPTLRTLRDRVRSPSNTGAGGRDPQLFHAVPVRCRTDWRRSGGTRCAPAHETPDGQRMKTVRCPTGSLGSVRRHSRAPGTADNESPIGVRAECPRAGCS
jgi:hypothetical protein